MLYARHTSVVYNTYAMVQYFIAGRDFDSETPCNRLNGQRLGINARTENVE